MPQDWQQTADCEGTPGLQHIQHASLVLLDPGYCMALPEVSKKLY